MKWLKEWAKPVFVVSVIGILANCASQQFDDMNQRFDDFSQRFDDMNHRFDDVDQRFDDVDQRFVRMDSRLRILEQRTFEMNTRLSRIEGHLGIPSAVADNKAPSTGRKESDNDRNIP